MDKDKKSGARLAGLTGLGFDSFGLFDGREQDERSMLGRMFFRNRKNPYTPPDWYFHQAQWLAALFPELPPAPGAAKGPRPTWPAEAIQLSRSLYRTGTWKETIAVLEKSMELRKGGNSEDWFFLGMAYSQLGEKEKARQWYEKALQWMDKNAPKHYELCLFRSEAAELLGAQKKSE
jgi:tetratricopeptide (TPR) repeat protein